jgi:opacity protein-like surface antigen
MHRLLLAALAATALTTVAHAAVVDLNFEGINSTYPSGYAFINGFYDGGTSSDGTSGPNYGVSFSSNAQAICLNSLTVVCSNTSRGGLAPGSDKGGLFFLSGSSTTIDVPAGFTTGFSFNYAEPNTQGGSVSVYSGVDGAGTVLASFDLSLTPSDCPGYGAAYCPFVPIGVAFAGTAESIVFGGVADYVVFDDVTFGATTPPPPGVPEPATWATMLAGLAGAGAMLRRRRSVAAA